MLTSKLFLPLLVLILLTACNSNKTETANVEKDTVQPEVINKKPEIKSNGDSIIISERIDGPANIRDSINGKLLFSLNDDVPVSATLPENKWLQVGIDIDLIKKEGRPLVITKGSKLFVDGKEVGQAFQDIDLHGGFDTKDGFKGELTGYTSASNIKPATVPENVLSSMINASSGTLTVNDFKQFFKDFGFRYPGDEKSKSQFEQYEIYENWIDDPSPMFRLQLVFEGENFCGVFHSRPLHFNGAKAVKAERGFYFSTLSKDEEKNKQLVREFNAGIVQVD